LKRLVSDPNKRGSGKEIDSLVEKEIIEEVDSKYIFKVELMKKWIENNT